MKYCFDIDGTICRTEDGQYETSVPIPERIQKINTLFDKGNIILFFTARGTTTGIDWTELTEGQLKSWGAKYHRLILGKPEADVYVDDRGTNSEDFDWE